MKTIITASALILISNVALASSWEDNWHSPDLNTGVYNKPQTLVEPKPSMGDVAVSLDDWGRGNPDYSAHDEVSGGYSAGSDEDFVSSLDEWGRGSHDHI